MKNGIGIVKAFKITIQVEEVGSNFLATTICGQCYPKYDYMWTVI
jgi:NAD(P)H-nitrite reductase large subunit